MAVAAPTRLTRRAGRRFAFTLGLAFLILAGLSYWRGHEVPPRVLGGLGMAFLAAGTFVPGRLDGVYRAWMAVGHGLSKITTPIVLGILYFCVLTPMRLLLLLWGHRPLRHGAREGSYWVPVPSGGRSNLHNQF
jgi:hypothetical protein